MDIGHRHIIVLLPKEALASPKFMFALRRAYDVLSQVSEEKSGKFVLTIEEDIAVPPGKPTTEVTVVCRGKKSILSKRETTFPYNVAQTVGALSQEFKVGIQSYLVLRVFH